MLQESGELRERFRFTPPAGRTASVRLGTLALVGRALRDQSLAAALTGATTSEEEP
ncbi:MAG TPA: hypothetical protein VIP05_33890 [Burkholderiaceae bacterium]